MTSMVAWNALGYANERLVLPSDRIEQLHEELAPLISQAQPGDRTDEAGVKYYVGDIISRVPSLRSIVEQALVPVWRRYLGDDLELLLNRHNCLRWPTAAAPSYWHRDTGHRTTSMLTSITYLESATVDNGCTEVVPGSHLLGLDADEAGRFGVPILAEAGDTLLFNAGTLHRSTPYQRGPRRYALVFSLRAPDELAEVPPGRSLVVSGQHSYRGN